MSELWRNALTGASTVPFFLDRLCNRLVSVDCCAVFPTNHNHKQNLQEAGNETYIDEAVTVTSVPAALAEDIWILTTNTEKDDTAENYIDFIVDRTVAVYVAYDAGAVSLPNWLGSFTNTGTDVQATDSVSPALHVYSRCFATGTVSLVGNLATCSSGADSKLPCCGSPAT
jgi:hypothetical protein